MLTFANTPDMTRFLEEYLDTKYPYKKYSQVAVDDFEFSGMENTNSTTLTKDILHDERVACDYKRDIEIVLHELTHQWLGDLVTINDWSDLWLSEGFATYFEHLYWENCYGVDEFQYKIMQTADSYFEESSRQYDRPIVTNVYKHPDELYDAHSYEKGGCVLHMLRSYIGDEKFRKSLKVYIETYRGKSVETDDLRKIIEKVSGENLRQFFDQWIYRGGHPQLNVEFSLEESLIKLKIIQMQVANDDDYMVFKFPLDIKLVFSSNGNDNDNKREIIEISKKVTEKTFNLRKDAKIRWISIDPNFKILKEIKSIKIVNETNEFQLKEMLKNQLMEGETIIERIEASRALKKLYSEDAVDALLYAIRKDAFYGVSIEVANTLGAYYDKNDYAKTNRAYQAIRPYLDKKIFSTLRAEIRRAVLRNIGEFEKEDSIKLLEPILLKEDESYFVRAAAAAAIGKSSKNASSSTKKEKIIPLLKTAVKKTSSFQNVIAAGAIDGLKELSKDKDDDVIVEIANFLIENSHYNEDYSIRLAATSALGKFLHTTNDENSPTLEEINQKAFDQLLK
ncbi:MAG: M1 family aminopeptidase, partial [Candidatus Nitrosopolaris sp.]